MGQIHIKQKISGFFVGFIALTGVFFGGTLQAAMSTPSLQPQALGRIGVQALRQDHPELTGQGVTVAVVARSFNYTAQGRPANDYQPDLYDHCLTQAKVNFFDSRQPAAGVSPHATEVCSILLGQDDHGTLPGLGSFRYQGVIPEAQTQVYEFEYFWHQIVSQENKLNVDVLSISCGYDQPGTWSRGLDALIDRQGLTVVASIGNGKDANSPTLYPGADNNVLGVGVVDAVTSDNLETTLSTFGYAVPMHSSFGPTTDHRCKPDLVAPGNCLVAVAGDPNRYEMSGNWSSYAAPIVAGVAGLLIEAGQRNPATRALLDSASGNCLIKSILMNSATKLPYWHKGTLSPDDDVNVPLDYAQGAGMVNAKQAYEQLMAGQQAAGTVRSSGWDFNMVSPGDTSAVRIYQFEVNDPCEQMIVSTLNWNRHYGEAPNFTPLTDLDADLRLELWAVDPNDPSQDVQVAVSDSTVDNVEHIYSKGLPGYNVYEVQVILNDAEAFPADFAERYALTWDVRRTQPQNGIQWYDLNSDGVVNNLDRKILINNWNDSLQSSLAYVIGDVNHDGVINALDLKILASKTNMQAAWYR